MNVPGGPTSRTSIPTSLAEINVTPLVDVMLVLLIVFMISAPLMQQGLQVDLPKANAGSINEAPDQIVLVVDKSGALSINGTVIKRGTLKAKMEAIAEAKPNVEVVIQADRTLQYGLIAQIMADVKQAKIHRIGLVTEPTQEASSL